MEYTVITEENIDKVIAIVLSLVSMGPFGRIAVIITSLIVLFVAWKFKSEIVQWLRENAAKLRDQAFSAQKQKAEDENGKIEAALKESREKLNKLEDSEMKKTLDEFNIEHLTEVAVRAYGMDRIKAIKLASLNEVEIRLAIYKLYGLK